MPLLEIRDLFKSYRDATRTIDVLMGIDLIVDRGEAVAIVGTSGSGKSTLLHLLGALDKPDQGDIVFDGSIYSELKDKQLALLRNSRLGFIYQFHYWKEKRHFVN